MQALLKDGPSLLSHTGVLYVIAFLVIRLMGKRSIGHLAPFDVAVIIMIGEAVAFGMEDPARPMWYSIIPVVFLGLLQLALTWVNLQWRPVESFTQGADTVLVRDGKALKENLNRERITKADLLTSLREKGITSVGDVKESRLEPTGHVSVIPMPDVSPMTPKAAGLDTNETLQSFIRDQMATLQSEITRLRDAVEKKEVSRA